MLSFFPRDVLDVILVLIGSVSEGFPSYSYVTSIYRGFVLFKRKYVDFHRRFTFFFLVIGFLGKIFVHNFSLALISINA